MRCDIVIPIWNQLGATKECLDSILRYTTCPYRLIIIDNDSDEATKRYLRGLKGTGINVILIENTKNLGFARAVNQGMKTSDAPYICVMNNDTVVTDGWLEEMIGVMESDHRIGILNPSSNTLGQFPAGSIDEYAKSLKPFKGQIQELYTARGFCMLIRRELIDRIGLLDEIYDIGYFEETDYCKRAHKADFMMARAKGAYVFHKESLTFKTLKSRDDIFRRNESIFLKRWGRHLRIGYLLDKIESKERINEIAIDTAHRGHQILIFLKKGLSWPVELDHIEIRRFDINRIFFGPISLYKIAKYRRKKPLNMIMTDEVILGAILKFMKKIHGADVIIKPDKDAVLHYLKEKSSVQQAS